MSKLLINEQPMQVLPTLAKVIGLNEAIFVQQLHYLLNFSRHQVEGKSWVYNTLGDWQAIFPFWSLKTVQRIVKNVEEQGIVLSTDKFNKMKMDKTKWYSIDYQKLEEIAGQSDQSIRSTWETPFGQNDQLTFGQNDQSNTTRDPQDITQDIPLPPEGESADAEDGGAVEQARPKNQISLDYQEIFDEFNQAVADTPIPQIRVFSDERKRKIKSLGKLLREQGAELTPQAFRDYFDDFVRQASARQDKFYFGGGKTGWVADFEYITRAKTFAKTFEDGL